MVETPAITSAPMSNAVIALRWRLTSCWRARQTAGGSITRTRIDKRWIGLHGPHRRMMWMKNELIATVSISVAHDHPIRRCGIVPFGAES